MLNLQIPLGHARPCLLHSFLFRRGRWSFYSFLRVILRQCRNLDYRPPHRSYYFLPRHYKRKMKIGQGLRRLLQYHWSNLFTLFFVNGVGLASNSRLPHSIEMQQGNAPLI